MQIELKRKIRNTFLILCLILFLGYYTYISYLEHFPISFTLETNEVPTIKINDMNVQYACYDNTIIYPTTFSTLYPNKIQVGTTAKYRRINELKSNNIIPIKIKLKNGEIKDYKIQTLPEFFPGIHVREHKIKNGYILTSVHGLLLVSPSYAIIVKPSGKLVWYRGNNNPTYSTFHLQQHRLGKKLRYSLHNQTDHTSREFVSGKHLLFDENFNIIDEIQLLKTEKHSEIPADEHEFVYLDDGHYIVLGYDKRKKFVKHYNKTVEYIANIIQEQKDGKVVFEWISDEHPEFFKTSIEKQPGNTKTVPDYLHINSIDIDPKDNNLVFSSASGYNIVKIDRKTGETIWILGGKLDEFKLAKKDYFIRQHDIQILDDNRLLLFDNGEYRDKSSDKFQKEVEEHNSRGLIFKLDENKKNVLEVKEIPFDGISPFMGSVQLLENNNTIFGCGGAKECFAKVINSDGEYLLNLSIDQPYFSYRSYWVESLK